MIVSLSLTYVLSAGLDGSGPAMRTLSVPFHESSSREADSPRVGPLTVPDPIRSPGRVLHPVTVWCASICSNDQYRFLTFERLITVLALDEEPWHAIVSGMSKECLEEPSSRYGSTGGSCAMASHLKGSSAARVTIQGEMLVPKFFPLKGPKGTYSCFWMSRAVQSFIRVIPKMCLDAASIVIGSPRSLPWPTKKATSSSISTHSEGANIGALGSSGWATWPQGRRIGVPETTTEEARPW
mmetsp:Transcript_4607/g.16489  ORF Transcript_4607/g.16489 Transcript_4607/m.16489 type:complete len:240 (+) Transcript_4607:253-972(+)